MTHLNRHQSLGRRGDSFSVLLLTPNPHEWGPLDLHQDFSISKEEELHILHPWCLFEVVKSPLSLRSAWRYKRSIH